MDYFYDIAHEHDQKFVDELNEVFTRYLKRTAEFPLRVKGIENIDRIPDECSVVFFSNHRSQLDYVVIPWVLYHGNVFSRRPGGKRPIAIAAGDNLFKRFGKWNFDKLVRKAGGYKIIRKPDPARIASITKTQIRYLGDRMNAGDWHLVFPERQRSYTGNLGPYDPNAIGVFQKAAKNSTRKVVFVPTTISNERTPEDRWFRAFSKYKHSNFRIKKAVYYALDWPLIYLQQYMNLFCEKPLGQISIGFGQPILCDGKQDRKDLTSRIEAECKSMVKAYPTNILSAALARTPDPEKVPEMIMQIQEKLIEQGAISEILAPEEIRARASRFLNAPFRRFFSEDYQIRRGDIIRYYNNSIKHFLDQT